MGSGAGGWGSVVEVGGHHIGGRGSGSIETIALDA